MTKLLNAPYHVRMFALDLWKKGDPNIGAFPYWSFLEEATFDDATNEVVFKNARWYAPLEPVPESNGILEIPEKF